MSALVIHDILAIPACPVRTFGQCPRLCSLNSVQGKGRVAQADERSQLRKLAPQLLDLLAQLLGPLKDRRVIALVPRGHLVEITLRHGHGGSVTGSDPHLTAGLGSPRHALASGTMRLMF